MKKVLQHNCIKIKLVIVWSLTRKGWIFWRWNDNWSRSSILRNFTICWKRYATVMKLFQSFLSKYLIYILELFKHSFKTGTNSTDNCIEIINSRVAFLYVQMQIHNRCLGRILFKVFFNCQIEVITWLQYTYTNITILMWHHICSLTCSFSNFWVRSESKVSKGDGVTSG